eukprot:SAG22_NODE_614_length_8559_cov_4.732033_4_plen_552_part_00
MTARSAALPARGAPQLTDGQLEFFGREGYLVCRNALSAAEVSRLTRPIHQAFRDGLHAEVSSSYPDLSTRYTLDGHILLSAGPDLAAVSCDDALVVSGAQQLLGEPEVVLSQFVSYLSPPGYNNAATRATLQGLDAAHAPGHGTHFDYKPQRSVGSFLDFIFVVIPLSDYTAQAGPLMLAPRSHQLTTVLPSSNGRVHPVDAAQVSSSALPLPCVSTGCVCETVPFCAVCPARQVPALEELHLLDPAVGPSDMIFMHGRTWHAYNPNRSTCDRLGLYMKLHPRSCPPAAGPLLHPRGLQLRLHPHIAPYRCDDGRYEPAVHCGGKVGQTVDEASLVLEDEGGGRVLLRRCVEDDGGSCWGLPSSSVPADAGGGYMDNANVIGPLAAGLAAGLGGPPLCWMSWLVDHLGRGGGSVRIRRVYAHRLGEPGCVTPSWAAAGVGCGETKWCTVEELRQLRATGMLQLAGLELQWFEMWVLQQDERGQPVRRGFGVANDTNFGYIHFDNTPGVYHIGRFSDGAVLPPAPEIDTPAPPRRRRGATVERLSAGVAARL